MLRSELDKLRVRCARLQTELSELQALFALTDKQCNTAMNALDDCEAAAVQRDELIRKLAETLQVE